MDESDIDAEEQFFESGGELPDPEPEPTPEPTYQAQPQRYVPDPQADPVGHLVAHNSALREALQTQQVANLATHTATLVDKFIEERPDYRDALGHLMEHRQGELQSMGMSEQDASTTVDNEALGIARAALEQGKNPGELVWELAQTRGYDSAKGIDNWTDEQQDKWFERMRKEHGGPQF